SVTLHFSLRLFIKSIESVSLPDAIALTLFRVEFFNILRTAEILLLLSNGKIIIYLFFNAFGN
ncbi:TPA: hypothetical protein MDR26_005120, partial [Klebsiella pneumoniae]